MSLHIASKRIARSQLLLFVQLRFSDLLPHWAGFDVDNYAQHQGTPYMLHTLHRSNTIASLFRHNKFISAWVPEDIVIPSARCDEVGPAVMVVPARVLPVSLKYLQVVDLMIINYGLLLHNNPTSDTICHKIVQ